MIDHDNAPGRTPDGPAIAEEQGTAPTRRAEDRAQEQQKQRLRSAIRDELAADAPDDLVRRAESEERGESVIELQHVSPPALREEAPAPR